MSMLLGPLSETMSNVSWRDCALACDQIAGAAGSTLPAANAVIDLRNSRRFMATSQWQRVSGAQFRKGHARTEPPTQMQNQRGGAARGVGGGIREDAPKPWAAPAFPELEMRRARGSATRAPTCGIRVVLPE